MHNLKQPLQWLQTAIETHAVLRRPLLVKTEQNTPPPPRLEHVTLQALNGMIPFNERPGPWAVPRSPCMVGLSWTLPAAADTA